jgi:transcriptional regulator with XRE-family HTH domain
VVTSDQTGPAGRDLPPLETLADKLEFLFERVRPPEEPGRKYTTKEIATKINEAAQRDDTGVTISAAYVGEMRRGITTDPRTSHVKALAQAFGVDPAFFVDSRVTRRVQEQIDLLNELRQMKVQQVALRRVLRQQGLSDDSTRLIEQLVDRCRKLEGLDEDTA